MKRKRYNNQYILQVALHRVNDAELIAWLEDRAKHQTDPRARTMSATTRKCLESLKAQEAANAK